MNVSELARSAGLSPSGVRWYERMGVLPAATRQANGYREYTDRDRSQLQLVATLRRLGLTPAEAGRLAALLLTGDASNPDIGQALAAHRETIRQQRHELERLDIELLDLEQTIAETTARRPKSAAAERRVSVLFLCNSNSGRSQMGEALLKRLGGRPFEAYSAGVHPREVSPLAVAALRDEGIDWSRARAKSVAEFVDRRFDYVVTLSDTARDECPELPGPHNALHWRLDDPSAVAGTESERLAAYHRTLAELRQRLQPFIELALITNKSKH